MNPFARFALFTVARDAGFVAWAALLLMLAFSFQPPLAFEIGATIALLFCVALLVRVYFLTEERLERSEVWRALPETERPCGEDERGWARSHLETILLRFAHGAAALACVFFCSAFILGFASGLADPDASHQFVSFETPHVALR